MQLDKNELNDRLIRDWFKRYTSLTPDQVEMFVSIKNEIQSKVYRIPFGKKKCDFTKPTWIFGSP